MFRTEKRRNPTTGQAYPWLARSTAMVNHFYLYAVDADFGPFFLKFGTYFPYNAKLCLNGHEYVKRQLGPLEPVDAVRSSRLGDLRITTRAPAGRHQRTLATMSFSSFRRSVTFSSLQFIVNWSTVPPSFSSQICTVRLPATSAS